MSLIQHANEACFGIALRAAIFHHKRLLLLLRSRPSKGETGFWELPGGRMNAGERYEEAVKREVFEETGLRIKVIKPLTVFDAVRDHSTQVIGITFLCALEEGPDPLRLSDEHLEARWVPVDQLDSVKLIPGLKRESCYWGLARD